MSKQLHLNTSDLGENRRYSFLKTPLEMQSPGQQPISFSHPAAVSGIPTAPQQAVVAQHQPVLNEKIQYTQQNSSAVEYPGSEQHPANYAPFSDEGLPGWSQHTNIPVSSSQSAPSTPPGPDPFWKNPEPPISTQTMSIVPDSNPLQSPKSPYFPPPTPLASPQPPAGFEMGAFHQPGQVIHPNQIVRGGTWSHGLCDCSNILTCCVGFICPCILYGKTQYRLSQISQKEDPTNMLGYESCNGSCTAMAVLCGCQWLLATIQHTRVRKAYGIRGGICSDCVRATCCMCCTLIQDETEIRKREDDRAKAARESGVTFLSPYAAPAQMSYGASQQF
ncbi:hypothetical protein FE257_011655 [Aspergillus nanangensis]|uniref:DUF614 domain protein n=1 Tax=Aspergillus nanangensis TaxID=2582783 RepID=A0AAD4GXS2_ASPNN|nr:hypothetical protein FE257_011655 [Aspergillus nanangensis]